MIEKIYALIDGEPEYFEVDTDGMTTVVEDIAERLDIARPVESGIYQIGNVDVTVEPAGGNLLRVVFRDSPAPEDEDDWRRNCPEIPDGIHEELGPLDYRNLTVSGVRRQVAGTALWLHRRSLRCYGADR